MKKIIALILVTVSLLTFTACSGGEDQPTPVAPEYPEFSLADGYVATGVVVDKNGNPLPGATLTVDKEVRGVTDSDGKYKITGLVGEKIVEIEFNRYDFIKDRIKITEETSSDVNFVGTNSYEVNASSNIKGNQVFGVTYNIDNGGKTRSVVDKYSTTTKLTALAGRTRITPKHDFYTFSPEYIDVYSSNDRVSFSATPNDATFSVSGQIFMEGMNDEDFMQPDLEIVDAKTLQVLASVEYETDWNSPNRQMVAKYKVYGLEKGKEYTLQIRDKEGNLSTEKIVVSESENEGDFEFEMTRKFKWTVTDVTGIAGFDAAVEAWAKAKYDETKDWEYDVKDLPKYIVEFLSVHMKYEVIVQEHGTDDDYEYAGNGVVSNIVGWPKCLVYMDFTLTYGGKTYIGSYRDSIVDRDMEIIEDNEFEISVNFTEK